MTHEVSHAATRERRPVYRGERRVSGLFERTLVDGTVVFDAAFRHEAKVHRSKLVARTKTDAIEELRQLRVDLARGEQHRSDALALTGSELADEYLAHLRSRIGHRDPKRRYSQRTVELYEQRLRAHVLPRLGRKLADEWTRRDLALLADKLGETLAPGTVTSVLNICSGMLRYGMKRGLVERNVARDLDRDDRPGTERLSEPRYLTPAQVSVLLDQLTETFRPVVAVLAYTGLRVSEAIGLTWGDVDLRAGKLTVRQQLGNVGEHVPVKTPASAATLGMLPALQRELREHRGRMAARNLQLVHCDALVFVTSNGKPQGRRNVLRAIYTAGDKAKLNGEGREPIGCHDLRHSLVGIALASGMSLAEAAELARHANVKTTAALYAGVADTERGKLTARLAEAGFGSQ